MLTEQNIPNKILNSIVDAFPLLQEYQTQIEDWAPNLFQLVTIIAVLMVTFTLVKSLKSIYAEKQSILATYINRASVWIYVLFAFIIVRAFFEITDFSTTITDVVIALTALRAIPDMMELTNLEDKIKRRVVITAWVLLALFLTQSITPLIAFLEAAQFTLGETTISLWAIAKAIAILTILLMGVTNGTKLIDKYFLIGNRKFSPSARTLIIKLTNILGVTLAFLITLDVIGIDLAAFAFFGGALGIGIGFGLQKVVGNLISGMILIIDKSIKPGDVIALGDTFGVVTAMRARYVVMRRRDGTEVLVPNESLMTTEVINWSFENRNVRVKINIGVSYDSDLEKVQDILFNVTNNHPRVMKDPEPRALLVGFGDSSIDFEVRFWLADPEEGIGSVRSEIYMEIWKQFKEEGIEIPFPQRVVHMANAAPQAPIKTPSKGKQKNIPKSKEINKETENQPNLFNPKTTN